jgi:hypothetical protein
MLRPGKPGLRREEALAVLGDLAETQRQLTDLKDELRRLDHTQGSTQ